MKTKFLLGILLAFIAAFGTANLAQAEGYSYVLNHQITIGDDLSTSVETNITATAGDGASVPGTIDIPVFGSSLESIISQDSSGNDIPATESDAGLTLRLNSIQAQGANDWSVTVSYTSISGLALGSSTIFMVSPFSYGDISIASEEVSIISGGELGTFVTRGAEPDEKTTAAGSFVNIWKSEGSELTSSFGLLFGDNAVSKVSFNKNLQNNTYWWQTQSVVLPPDTNQQKVFISDISPAPKSVKLDEDGNIIVEFRLRPRQSIDVNAELQITVNSYTYALESALLTNDIDPLLTDRYGELNEDWADTSVVVEGAETIAVADLVEQIYSKIAKEYATVEGDNPYDVAIARSNALIGELRANGVPARLVIGAIFGDGSQVFINPQPSAWAEVYIPDVGWITLDPNFEQNGPYFGVADVQRIALALRGFDPDYPPENSTSFRIDFVNAEPPAIPVMKPEITATKHMILPGFSLNTVNINMPGGVIVDNTAVVVGAGEPMQLGSLAPLQKLSIRSTSMLAGAFTSESVQYGIFSGGELTDSDILAQATMSVSYIPMIVLIGFVTLVAIFAKWIWPIWHSRRLEKKSGKEPKKDKKDSGRNKLKMKSDKSGDDIENVDMLAALDLPEDDQPDDDIASIDKVVDEFEKVSQPQSAPAPVTSPRPIAKMRVPDQIVQGSPAKPVPKPVLPAQPKQAQPTPLNLEKAHEATPEEIRREMQKKQPKHLIQ